VHQEPTITVWTPVYNGEELLPRCIESVVNQTIRPLEYLILDDASTDNSLGIAKSYAKDHPWIRVIPNDQNRGAFANFKRIYDLAKGDFLYAVAVDDRSFPRTLERFADALRQWPGASLVSGMMALDNSAGETVGVEKMDGVKEKSYFTPDEYLSEYLLHHPANHSLGPCTAYRKSAAEKVGGLREELQHWADSFLHRALSLESGMVYVPEIVHSFTMSQGSISQEACKDGNFLDTLRTTIQLMRSPEFSDRFPEEYIQYWDEGYRQIMYDSVVDSWHTITTDRNLLLFSALGEPSLANKFTGALVSLLMKIEQAFLLPRIKKYASRYHRA
jgi:glycosyltransferase involved in cell wall biosynthesis